MKGNGETCGSGGKRRSGEGHPPKSPRMALSRRVECCIWKSTWVHPRAVPQTAFTWKKRTVGHGPPTAPQKAMSNKVRPTKPKPLKTNCFAPPPLEELPAPSRTVLLTAASSQNQIVYAPPLADGSTHGCKLTEPNCLWPLSLTVLLTVTSSQNPVGSERRVAPELGGVLEEVQDGVHDGLDGSTQSQALPQGRETRGLPQLAVQRVPALYRLPHHLQSRPCDHTPPPSISQPSPLPCFLPHFTRGSLTSAVSRGSSSPAPGGVSSFGLKKNKIKFTIALKKKGLNRNCRHVPWYDAPRGLACATYLQRSSGSESRTSALTGLRSIFPLILQLRVFERRRRVFTARTPRQQVSDNCGLVTCKPT